MDAQFVLVDSDDFPILQDGPVVGFDGPQVDGHEQGSGKDGPHGHLGLGLFVAEAEIADDQLQEKHTKRSRSRHILQMDKLHGFLRDFVDTQRDLFIFLLPAVVVSYMYSYLHIYVVQLVHCVFVLEPYLRRVKFILLR